MVDTPRPALARARLAGLLALRGLPAFALLPAFGVALALLAGGCGYHQDVPHLPGGAHTLTLQHIANLTDTGELDTRLRVLLQQRLSQQAYIHLGPPYRSELGLSIDLLQLGVSRAVDPAQATTPSTTYTLSGRITLVDLRTGQKYADAQSVSASVSRNYPPNQLETPAVQDDSINAVLKAFAAQVQQTVEAAF